ncbi:uncharacterized protein LOC143518425 isoform X2 [Brachyhypopomus gauderio]|uniref:uncharacterized protein LOC143518425 isoform X2 n=1 Tax=Brachyhypopomus gauderio TaxID=698409 RepID=UPI00404135E5
MPESTQSHVIRQQMQPVPMKCAVRKAGVTEGYAEEGGRVKRKNRRGSACTIRKAMGTGYSQALLDLNDSVKQDVIIPQEQSSQSKEPDVNLEEQDVIEKCPDCSSSLKPIMDKAGRPAALLRCPRCPGARLLCGQCLYLCPMGTPSCANQSCQLVSILLTCEKVTDPKSRVHGCPLFRACPGCRSLMMHERGCKYVTCAKCKHKFCFVCLRASAECRKDPSVYWLLSCSQPRAARQRFHT